MSAPSVKNVPGSVKNVENKISGQGIAEMSIHQFYSSLDLVVFSGFTLAAKKKNGKWEKDLPYGLPKAWSTIKTNEYNQDAATFAMITGETSGIVVIDIDDPTIEHNKRLIELMTDCTMVQQTKKGFHYVYRYDPRVPQSKADDNLKLDVRSGDVKNKRGIGCIFCEPTRLLAPDGTIVSEYKWIKKPASRDEILPLPDAVVDELDRIRPNFYVERPASSTPVEPAPTPRPLPLEPSENPLPPLPSTDNTLLLQLADCITNCDAYTDWLNNGIICFNEGLPCSVWDAMSQKSTKYQRGACEAKWKSFKANPNRKLTAASWWKWLKEHNYIKFKELGSQRDDTERLYRLINHKEFANIFFNLNPDAYLYHDRMGWFQLNPTNIWKHYPSKEPEQILSRISDCLMKYTKEMIELECERYARLRAQCNDPERGKVLLKEHEKRMNYLEKGHQSFGSASFCKGVFVFLNSYYYRETLEEEMNMSINLFAFSNGKCVDLTTSEVRDIKPSDYISQTTGYALPKCRDDEARETIKKFLWGLFENQEVIDYVLRVLAMCLYGENRFHEYYVFTGTGGNGKGMIASLIQSCFGEYYHTVDITLFTKPRERADQPIPALVDARYKRLMMTTEPEKDDEFQKGLLKKVSGDDLIEARTLFSKDIIRYKPQFKTIFQTNGIPKIKLDDGIGRRMKVINFPFKFRPENECTTPLHRIADPFLKHTICTNPDIRDEFVILLLETYQDIREFKSLPLPASVRDATGEYFDENNPIKFWLTEKFDLTGNNDDKIPATELQRFYINDRNLDRSKFNQLHFAQGLQYNGIEKKRFKTGYCYIGIKRKDDDDPLE